MRPAKFVAFGEKKQERQKGFIIFYWHLFSLASGIFIILNSKPLFANQITFYRCTQLKQ